MDALERGEGSSSFKLTIPEGLAVSQTAELLNEDGTIDGDEYADLAEKPSEFVVPEVGGEAPDVTTLEGLLFPEHVLSSHRGRGHGVDRGSAGRLRSEDRVAALGEG